MITLLVTLLIIPLALAALHGWGALFARLARIPKPGFAVTAALGLGVCLFLGGVLNVARLAYAPSLGAVFIAGLVLFGLGARAWWRELPRDAATRRYAAVIGVLTVGVLAFTVMTQLPPSAYNIHDDLEKYFAQPTRMLQTGTLIGSPLSSMGKETFGGQAFLHGFVVAVFPFEMINGVDAVFCMVLCMLIAAGAAVTRPGLGPVGALSALLVWVIHTQYVNTSSLYSTIALIMALALLTGDPRLLPEGEGAGRWPRPIVLGLCYAGLLVLKGTAVPFVAAHFGLGLAAITVVTRSPRQVVRQGALTGLWSAAFMAPWLALHLPHHLSPVDAPPFDRGPAREFTFPDFLSTDPVPWGGSYAHYTLLAAVLLLIAILAAARLRKGSEPAAQISSAGILVSTLAGLAAFGFVLVILGKSFLAHFISMRYGIPVLIALAATTLTLTAGRMIEVPAKRRPHPVRRAVPVVIALVLTLGFLPLATDRWRQAASHGHILAFGGLAIAEAYLDYNRRVLDGERRAPLTELQRLVPEGEPILVWVMTPFELDFARNPLLEADPAGLVNPWAQVTGVEHLLVEYKGYAMRPRHKYEEKLNRGPFARRVALAALQFAEQIKQATGAGERIRDDGRFALYRIDPETVFGKRPSDEGQQP